MLLSYKGLYSFIDGTETEPNDNKDKLLFNKSKQKAVSVLGIE